MKQLQHATQASAELYGKMVVQATGKVGNCSGDGLTVMIGRGRSEVIADEKRYSAMR